MGTDCRSPFLYPKPYEGRSKNDKKKKEKASTYQPPKISLKHDMKKNWPVYLMFLPLAIYFIIFNYIPMAGILMAFERFSVTKELFGSTWVGMKNFADLFTGVAFTTALRNTVCMAILHLVFGFFPPIILAIIFSECKCRPFRRLAQISSYLPNFISAVVVCALAIEFLKDTGAVSVMLTYLGLPSQNWLANGQIPVFWLIYVLIGVWIGAGYGSIIYTTSIANVNHDLKEAAALDGANRWDRIRYIVIPTVMPLAMMMLTMSVGTIFMAGWDKVLLLYMPKTYNVADVLYTYTYRMAFGDTVNFGLSTASGLFQSIVGTILLIVSNALNKKATSFGLFQRWRIMEDENKGAKTNCPRRQKKEKQIARIEESGKLGMVENPGIGGKIADACIWLFLVLVIAVSVIPLWHVIMASLSDGRELLGHAGMAWLPVGKLNFGGYRILFQDKGIISGYVNTFIYVAGGTALGLLMNIMAGYVLSRDTKFKAVMILFFGVSQ